MEETIFTSRQSKFLELATKEKEITLWYYFTGGTALSEFYLKHRLSDDIDLFTTSDVNDREIDKIIKKAISLLQAKSFQKRKISGLFIYELEFADGKLKIDFANYPFEPVERGKKWNNLLIDSFYDIAINKLYTVQSRSQIRDFIDLYFILLKGEFSLEQLIERTNEKFNTIIDPLYLSSQLLKVFDLPKAYPTMLKPFKFEEMIKFYNKQAEKLGEKIFK